jgi:hypothetical protein
MKLEISDILAHLGVIAFGITVAFMPSMALELMPTWAWQILIGLGLTVTGTLLWESVPGNQWAFFEHVRGHTGWVGMLLGIVVFLNFARYDEIIGMTGPWPLYVCGGLLMVNGMLRILLVAFANKSTRVVTQ